MNDKDKKFLAEWLGWTVDDLFPCAYSRNLRGKEVIIPFAKWNPDINHIQFGEIWAQLMHSYNLRYKTDIHPHAHHAVDDVLRSLPRVMDQVLKALRADANECRVCDGTGDNYDNMSSQCYECEGTGIKPEKILEK